MKLPPKNIFFWLLWWSLTSVVVSGRAHPAQAYVEGDVIITFKPGADLSAGTNALARHALGLKKHFAELSRLRGKHAGLVHDKTRTTAQLMAELRADPAVETAEPNYLRWVTGIPNDTLFTNLWGLKNTGQSLNSSAGKAGDDIRFVPAWALARTTTNPVVVAVIDTGVDYTHPDLAGNMWVNLGETAGNGVDDDGNGYVDDVYGYDFADNLASPQDSGFHGTHVAGTIAAIGNNNLGVIGVNYQARIMALRVSSDGNTISSAAEISALGYATTMKNRGVNLVAINASFGGGGYNSTEVAAIQAAGNAGIIFCAAAGNATNNNDTAAFYPANYRLNNMIVVAASDQNDALATFSNYGASTVDLAAPGVNIFSTLPVAQAGTTAYVQQGSNTYSATELTYAGTTTGTTGTVYYCGLGNPADFPAGVRNNLALIQRGTLTFSNKVVNAMAAGARGAIIYNNVSGTFLGTLGGANNWIPAIALSQADGQTLQALLPVTAKLFNGTDPANIYQYLDGTSMATPHVVGAVAFAAQNFPTETVTQRIQRVLNNVDAVAGLTGKVRTGGRLNLQRIVDTDLNGLPDWWEQQYFARLTGSSTNLDTDHDGLNNLAEFLAGTNPTNATSNLGAKILANSKSNTVSVAWASVAGKSYWVERAGTIPGGFHTVIATNIVATPPTNTLTDTNLLGNKTQFYRVGVAQ